MIGHIHSIESFGTVDGPGVRFVIFLKGCPMRCQYCHNPDTWEMGGGTEMTVEQIMEEFERSKDFYTRGGITVTGGEPLVQLEFVTELFEEAHRRGIHTCLDTSGITFRPDNPALLSRFERLLAVTNLVMLDIKHIDPQKHLAICKQPQNNILAFARYLERLSIPVWIRHVVVPGLSDNEEDLYQLGRFIGTLHNVKALDVLPYHDMGKAKYHKLGIPYPLENVSPLPREKAVWARTVIIRGIRDERKKAFSNASNLEQ